MKRFLKYTINVLVVIMLIPMATEAQTIKRQSSKNAKTTKPKSKKEQSSAHNQSSTKATAKRNSNQRIDASYSNGILTVNGETYRMIFVQGGIFTMGATQEIVGDINRNCKPTHEVMLSDYYIGQTEVTQALWKAVMGSNPSHFKGDLQRPVENVSWEDCQKFIQKINRLTGLQFRLPTEAEWEYAARGGNKSRGYLYSGSNNLDVVAWYDKNSGLKPHPVGTKSPNELGLYDMSGNVYESCQDWYDGYSYNSQTNPTGPSSGTHHVSRGGGWAHGFWGSRVSYRSFSDPKEPSSGCGLRLAL